MYDLRHLEHAVALAEHGGFRRAAQALGISQPALSRSIRVLEEALGVRLFDRGHGGVEPTIFGSLVVERGRAMVQDRAELEREIQALQGLELGDISVGMGPYPAALSGGGAVARMLARHPNVGCDIRVSDWREVTRQVMDRAVDLGVAEASLAATHPELETEPIGRRPLYFFCRAGHPLLSRGRLTVQELAEFPWAGTLVPGRIGSAAAGVSGRAGRWDELAGIFVPAVRLAVVSQIADIARASDVLVGATFTMVEGALAAGEIAVLPFTAEWLRLDYGIMRLHGRTSSPSAVEFMAILREVEADVEARERELTATYL